MRNQPVRRLLGVVGAVGALVAATATPALAETAKLSVYQTDTTVAIGTAGKLSETIVRASKAVQLTDGTVTYDLSNLPATVKVSVWGGNQCTPSGKTLRCWLEDGQWLVESGNFAPWSLRVEPTEAAKDGEVGTIKVTLGAKSFASISHEAKVRVGEGVDLSGLGKRGGEEFKFRLAPGTSFTVPLQVRNAGKTKARGAAFVLFSPPAIQPVKRYSNCTYAGDRLSSCRFDDELAPDTAYDASVPMKVGTDAYAPSEERAEVTWMTLAELEDYESNLKGTGGSLGERGTGDELTLTASVRSSVQADTDPLNNRVGLLVTVTGKNGTDLYAIGDSVTGKVGDVITARIGFGNNGPASLSNYWQPSPVSYFVVGVPAGTSVVERPAHCNLLQKYHDDWFLNGSPTEPTYLCSGDAYIRVRERQTVEFRLRINKVVPNATGQVKVNAKCVCNGGFADDLKPANDVARLVVNPTDQDGGGTLPVTGSSIGLIAGAGGLLLAAGAVSVMLTRRRTRFVA